MGERIVQPDHFASPAGNILWKTDAYIDGARVPPDRRLAVDNPATGAVIARVSCCGPAQAQSALPAWAARPAKQRAVVLRRWNMASWA